jgi:hypothetical protein
MTSRTGQFLPVFNGLKGFLNRPDWTSLKFGLNRLQLCVGSGSKVWDTNFLGQNFGLPTLAVTLVITCNIGIMIPLVIQSSDRSSMVLEVELYLQRLKNIQKKMLASVSLQNCWWMVKKNVKEKDQHFNRLFFYCHILEFDKI